MDDSIRQLFVYSDCQKLQFDEPTAGKKTCKKQGRIRCRILSRVRKLAAQLAQLGIKVVGNND